MENILGHLKNLSDRSLKHETDIKGIKDNHPQIYKLSSIGFLSHRKTMKLIEEQQEYIKNIEIECMEFSNRIKKLEHTVKFYLKKAA